MKINFYIGPRQSGKTQRALERYSENPESSVLFVHNSRSAAHLKDIMFQMGIENPIIRSAEHLGSIKDAATIPNPRLKDKNTIICDEYLFWSERSKAAFLDFLSTHTNVENVLIFTSLDRFYDLAPKTEVEKYVFQKSKQEDPYNLIFQADVIIQMAATYDKHREMRQDDRVLIASRLK
jgi:thymidine kinase